MNVNRTCRRCFFLSMATFGAGLVVRTAGAQQPPPPPPPQEYSGAEVQAGVEVLTRGPVHEAFAETIDYDPEPSIEVTQPPPEPIEELPPEEKPEGPNVAWVPGYWAWDDERNDYVWISGIWRSLPPGRQWVPGYWVQANPGYRWVAGYWLDAEVEEVSYLPEPPESVEIGANIQPPSPDHVWVPGCWIWVDGRYAWRPGYWLIPEPNWVWTPAHYVWAPRGYVFVDGYWDYAVVERGVLFAPAYVETTVRVRREFYYRPTIAIDLNIFVDHLFVRPRYCHYYFGDYYEPRYREVGIFASFTWHRDYSYDPIYVHRRWHHRHEHDWDHRIERDFHHRREHHDARPPRTYRAQVELAARVDRPRDRSIEVAGRIDVIAKRQEAAGRYRRVESGERDAIVQRTRDVRRYGEERREIETKRGEARPERAERPERVERPDQADRPNRPDRPEPRQAQPERTRIRKSPIAGRADQFKGDRAPPKRQEAPQPDRKVEPRQRKPGSGPQPRTKRAKPDRP